MKNYSQNQSQHAQKRSVNPDTNRLKNDRNINKQKATKQKTKRDLFRLAKTSLQRSVTNFTLCSRRRISK